MTVKTLKAALYQPTTSLTGNASPTVYRGENVVLRGLSAGDPYFEVFTGNLNLNEDFAGVIISGRLDFTAGDENIGGSSGTLFKSELHQGQMIQAENGEVFVVRKIVSDIAFISWRVPTVNGSSQRAYRLHQMFELKGERGVMLTGSAVKFDKGIIFVGSGDLSSNGSNLGGPFTATARPQVLIFRPETNDYELRPLGFDFPPPAPTINVITGGTKALVDQNKYSFMASWWTGSPDGTDGQSDPCAVIKKDGAAADIKINGVNNRFEADVTNCIAAAPTNAKGIIVWQSLGGKKVISTPTAGSPTTTNPNEGNFDYGPWYKAVKVPFYSVTFAPGDINIGTDTITLVNHKFDTADRIFIASSGTAPTFTILGPAAPIPPTTAGYIIRVDDDHFKIAATKDAAAAGTADDITAAGAGVHTISYLQTGDKFPFELLDSELGPVVTSGNKRPPLCEFVGEMAGRPVYISCFGEATTAEREGANPGPYCAMSKYDNPDGVPREWTRVTKCKNDIVGFFPGPGRLFLATPSTMQFAATTGLQGQLAGVGIDTQVPMIVLDYWKTGLAHRYSATAVEDTVFGRSGGKLFQSIGNADENVKKYDFGGPVEAITRAWNDGHVQTYGDSKNNCVMFVSSADHKNDEGFWVSIVQPYSLTENLGWMPAIVLDDSTRDSIISGGAAVSERFEFLMGGRDGKGNISLATYRFDEPDPANPVTSVKYYVIWQPSDDGAERRSKKISMIRLVAKGTNVKIQFHGAKPGQDINVDNMMAGTGALLPDIAFANSSMVKRYLEIPLVLRNLGTYAIRYAGEWDGTGMPDQLHEIAIEVGLHGRPR